MSYLSIRDLDLKGKRVFIRVDFNVPLQKNEQGVMEITSDKRIKASLPTIQYALEQGAGVILASHLGRPKGKPNAEMSLQPVDVPRVWVSQPKLRSRLAASDRHLPVSVLNAVSFQAHHAERDGYFAHLNSVAR